MRDLKANCALYLLDTPYYARNLYRAIYRGIPGVRKSWSGPLQWRDWPETREMVAEVEHRFNLNKLGNHGYPGDQMAERIQLLRYQNSINCRWRRLRLRLHYNGWRTMFEKAFERGGSCWNVERDDWPTLLVSRGGAASRMQNALL